MKSLEKNICYYIIVISAVVVGSIANAAPTMNGDQVFSGVRNQKMRFALAGASDLENLPLTYSLVSGPSLGRLKNCLNETDTLMCEFVPPPEFRGTSEFTYKANNGTSDSLNTSKVLRIGQISTILNPYYTKFSPAL